MYGGSRAPSLLPKFSIDYVVHKKEVRHSFIDGVGNFLFDMKKATVLPLPFCIGCYKFTKVKRTSEFVQIWKKLLWGEEFS